MNQTEKKEDLNIRQEIERLLLLITQKEKELDELKKKARRLIYGS